MRMITQDHFVVARLVALASRSKLGCIAWHSWRQLIYLATLAPLARAALGGQGAVMIHHVRPIGLTDYVTEVIQMARAARDVGVRVAFGVGMRVARASRSHLRETIVAGRRILHQGKIIGIELDAVQKELRIAYRAAMPSRADFLNAWPGFGAAICAHHQNRLGCC